MLYDTILDTICEMICDMRHDRYCMYQRVLPHMNVITQSNNHITPQCDVIYYTIHDDTK